MRPFRSLSARLTVQFALLFAGAMLAVSPALSTFIAGAASREVEVSSSRAARSTTGCGSSVRTNSRMRPSCWRATSVSAPPWRPGRSDDAVGAAQRRRQVARPDRLHRQRRRTGFGHRPQGSLGRGRAAMATAGRGRLTGVAVLAGRPRQLVAAPIMAPTLIGWVVFAADLDAARDARARTAVGDPAPRRGARQRRRALGGGGGQHVGARASVGGAGRQAMSAAVRRSKCASRGEPLDRARQAAADLLGR